eukprot:759140-Hanusia_phi.AAC.2
MAAAMSTRQFSMSYKQGSAEGARRNGKEDLCSLESEDKLSPVRKSDFECKDPEIVVVRVADCELDPHSGLAEEILMRKNQHRRPPIRYDHNPVGGTRAVGSLEQE